MLSIKKVVVDIPDEVLTGNFVFVNTYYANMKSLTPFLKIDVVVGNLRLEIDEVFVHDDRRRTKDQK